MIRLIDINTNKITYFQPDDAVTELYYNQKVRIPNENELSKNEIKKIRIELSSKADKRIPLYDPYNDNLYLIDSNNVYNRIAMHYRFPNHQLLQEMENRIKEMKSDIVKVDDTLTKTKIKKLMLMVSFLKSFDLNVLETTYIKAFYSHSVGKDITICKRSSFLPYYHTSPYYSRSEIINMARNMEIIKPDNTIYTEKKLHQLCKRIQQNDISASIILNHHQYIAKQEKIGLIQYYSLHGAFTMNQYLRNMTSYKEANKQIEREIKEIWKLILEAPVFDKEYIIYRFVKSDSYIRHLKIGDLYIDKGFLSTTRDPLYRSDEFSFGFILIKIKIPKNQVGIGICMETYSHFPKEQEILIAPRTVLRLVKKDSNCIYYHTDAEYASKIETRYEFIFVGTEDIQFDEREPIDDPPLV